MGDDVTLKQLSDLVADICGTPCVAVWSCAFGRLELRHARNLSQRHLNAAHAAWRELRLEMQDGKTVSDRGVTFVPLLSRRQDLVGLLAMPVPPPRQEAAVAFLDEMLWRIARHVERPVPLPEPELLAVPLDLLATPGGIETLLRDAYELLMTRFGWNVSLVASLLGVPRLTLRRRLARVGADRPHPSPKARQRRPAPAGSEIDDAVRSVLWPRVDAATLPSRLRRGSG